MPVCGHILTQWKLTTASPATEGATPDSPLVPAPEVHDFAEVPEEVYGPLPVAELHLHIEGTLEPELIFALAERNGIQLPYADLDELRSRYEFTDLQSFLDLYYANMAVLQTEQDFADMTRAYLTRAALAGVRHAEIMLDPQAHLSRGVALATCVNGVASVLATSARGVRHLHPADRRVPARPRPKTPRWRCWSAARHGRADCGHRTRLGRGG